MSWLKPLGWAILALATLAIGVGIFFLHLPQPSGAIVIDHASYSTNAAAPAPVTLPHTVQPGGATPADTAHFSAEFELPAVPDHELFLLIPSVNRSATVSLNGETLFDSAARIDLPAARRRIGYVFQEPRLFPHLRVGANLRYGRHRGEGGIHEDELIAALDIAHLLDRWPRTLSGGEARRVAIGRALLANPRFLLLDEPLSSLDHARRDEIMRAIEFIRDRLKLPILMVTHDPDEAARLATRIVRL